MIDELTSADFAPHLNESFSVDLGNNLIIDLELIAVTDLNPATAAQPEGRRPFSIEFLGPISQQYLPQHIYRLEHAAFGALAGHEAEAHGKQAIAAERGIGGGLARGNRTGAGSDPYRAHDAGGNLL